MLFSELFDPHSSDETPIACDLSVLDAPERHKRRAEALFADREAVRAVSDGVALRFPGTMEHAERALDFVPRERQCCPFLTFSITFEPEQRGVWLFLGGDEQAAAYVQEQFRAQVA